MEMKLDVIFYRRSDGNGKYDVIVDDEPLETWVTRRPSMAKNWIRGTENWNYRRLHRLIVGLDIEWRPNTKRGQENPVAILQLFVSRRCLIYQLQNARKIPDDLKDFLKNPNYTFVGVGIERDKQKLYRDYSLEVTKTADLRDMAAHELKDPDLRNAGLRKLAKVILRKDVNHEKLLKVRMSDWDNDHLSKAQVLYACLDAYLSFAIGRQLQSWYD